MRKTFSVWLGCALLVACGGAERSGDGLVISSASAVSGLSGTYAKGGVTVRFDALRGEPSDGTDPDAPAWTVDARFADAAGRSVALSGAEDSFGGMSDGEVDVDQRAAEMALILEAADALSSADVGEAAPERDALLSLASALRVQPLVRAPAGEVLYACSTGYLHEFVIRTKPVAVLGQHSAVGLWSYYRKSDCTETNVGYKQSCNHGACASAMTTDACWWSSGLRSYSFPVFQSEPSQNPSTVSGACSTKYSLTESGAHVCNDDSYMQVCNIRLNKSYARATGPNGTCSDASLRGRNPGCAPSCP